MSSSGNDDSNARPTPVPSKKGLKFWLIFISMCICLFLSALEASSISTALPTIANDLRASQFTWVGSAYALASTAVLPMSGGLAQTFGRRPAMLIIIGLFALGSGICGAANTMNMLIAGRTIQGLGGGGIQSLTGIILGDLVTLQERGMYAGLFGLTWCVAASIGPVIGGSFAAHGQWRWLFYLNLPLSLVACAFVFFLLDLPVPSGSYREKFMRMDWIGNFLAISSTVAYTIGLTWGGITAPWNSAMVFFPLSFGLVGLGCFILYEATLATHPLVPFSLLTNITSISGYIQTFCATLATQAVIYYVPVYFQACKSKSPVVSGLYSLALASLAPTAIIIGISVKATGRYRPQMWIGWALSIICFGLMSNILATDPLGKSIAYLTLLGCGMGMLSATPMFPILAPLPVTQNAPALAFIWLLRSFAAVWGITIGSTVLQNELPKKLSASLIRSIPQGTSITYELIPQLSTFPPETLSEIQVAFAESIAVVWRVLAVVCGAGLLASLFMKGFPLHTSVDKDWAIKDDWEKVDRRDAMMTDGLAAEDEVLDISAAAAAMMSMPFVASSKTSIGHADGRGKSTSTLATVRPWIPSMQFSFVDLQSMLLDMAESGFL